MGRVNLTFLKQGPGGTPHRVPRTAATGRIWQQSLQQGGEVPNYRRNWSQVGSSVTRRNQKRGMPSHCPCDKLSWWRCSGLKIRTITSWGSQVCGKVSCLWVGCRWSRHWFSSKECSQSTGTVFLCALAIQKDWTAYNWAYWKRSLQKKKKNLGEILPTKFLSTIFLSCLIKQNFV